MNLIDLLKVNQLLVEFDNTIERITGEILEFWENLVNSKESLHIFNQGLKISYQIQEMHQLLLEISENQSDSETKIYL